MHRSANRGKRSPDAVASGMATTIGSGGGRVKGNEAAAAGTFLLAVYGAFVRMSVVIAAMMSCATVLMLLGLQYASKGWMETAGALSAMQAELSHDQHQAFDAFDETMANIAIKNAHGTQPSDAVSAGVLNHGTKYFARYLEHNTIEPANAYAVARAYLNMGNINRVLRKVDAEEQSLRNARVALLDYAPPEPKNRFVLAKVDNRLTSLLAQTGKWDEAHEVAVGAVSILEDLTKDNAAIEQREELAIAYRNLALTTAVVGGDGIPLLGKAIGVTNQLAKETEELAVHEFAADAYALTMALHWKQQQFVEAEEAGRNCIAALNRTLLEANRIASAKLIVLPALQYKSALALAAQNLDALRSDVQQESEAKGSSKGEDSPSLKSPLPSAWQWSPIAQEYGGLLPHGLLQGGRLPGEFERQESLLLVWHDQEWCVPTSIAIIAATYQQLQVIVIVNDDLSESEARRALKRADIPPDAIRFWHAPTDTLWVRDFGPAIIDSGRGTYKCLDADYGTKSRFQDDVVPSRAARLLGYPTIPIPISIEWGAVLSNGNGLCVVSTKVLESNRARGYSERHITDTIKRITGAEQVIYLEPMHGEPNGHLDWFATFVSPDTMVLGDYGSIDPDNASLLDRHAAQLSKVKTRSGPLHVVRIPMPPRGSSYFGGTYTNVVYANDVLLVPIGDNRDTHSIK